MPPPLLGICLSSLWSPLFPLHALASIPLLSRQGTALFALTTSHPEQTAMFLFRFGKGGSGVLANCSFCGTEATLSFSAVPVCSSFSAEACAILQALFWSRQHQQVCHFPFPPLWFPLCPLLHFSFYLKPSGRSGRNCFLSPPVLSGYNWYPETRFSQRTTRLMS